MGLNIFEHETVMSKKLNEAADALELANSSIGHYEWKIEVLNTTIKQHERTIDLLRAELDMYKIFLSNNGIKPN